MDISGNGNFCCRDLDLAINSKNSTSYIEASAWGYRYFNCNFNKLVKIKTRMDPEYVLRHEPSIPPLPIRKVSKKRNGK